MTPEGGALGVLTASLAHAPACHPTVSVVQEAAHPLVQTDGLDVVREPRCTGQHEHGDVVSGEIAEGDGFHPQGDVERVGAVQIPAAQLNRPVGGIGVPK